MGTELGASPIQGKSILLLGIIVVGVNLKVKTPERRKAEQGITTLQLSPPLDDGGHPNNPQCQSKAKATTFR